MRRSSDVVKFTKKQTKKWQNVISLSLPCCEAKGGPQILCMYKMLQL